MTNDVLELDSCFDELIERGRAEVQSGALDTALETFERAEQLAREQSQTTAADRAWLNRCTVLIAMQSPQGQTETLLRRMRSILTLSEDQSNRWLAAYNIAQAYELTDDHRKGLFYARVALDRARILDSTERLASSYNQLGLLLLATSRFEEAGEAFEQALGLLPPGGASVRRAAIEDNLGYVQVVQGALDEGFRLLYSSLRALRSLGNRREQVFPHLRLCFAHLEADRHRDALRHGLHALALAEEFDETVSIQYALFLLGEAAQRGGDLDTARAHFQQLQERYYPGQDNLSGVLMTLDVCNLINLRA